MLVINPFRPGTWTRDEIDNVSSNWWVLLLTGIVSVVAGGIILFTDWSVGGLAVFIGAVLLFQGVFTMFSVPLDGSGRGWSVALGVIETLVGLAVLVWPGPTLLVIAFFIGWYVLFSGIMTIAGAISARGVLPYWGLMLAFGILETLFSFWLLARPGLTLVAAVIGARPLGLDPRRRPDRARVRGEEPLGSGRHRRPRTQRGSPTVVRRGRGTCRRHAMSNHHDHPEHDDDDGDEQHTSRFVRVADRVSYAMGTWQNIVVWIILVGTWFAFGPYLANHSVLPAWFTSNNFNFPLNTVTTIAELYIGFLVGASTNRTERHNRNQADRMETLERLIHDELRRNTEITDNADAIAEQVQEQVPLLERTHADVERLLAAVSVQRDVAVRTPAAAHRLRRSESGNRADSRRLGDRAAAACVAMLLVAPGAARPSRAWVSSMNHWSTRVASRVVNAT